jgi:hypothetical protein
MVPQEFCSRHCRGVGTDVDHGTQSGFGVVKTRSKVVCCQGTLTDGSYSCCINLLYCVNEVPMLRDSSQAACKTVS